MPKVKLDQLTEPMFYTLIALLEARCGIEITEFVLKITHQRVRLGPGTLYTMLSKFSDEKIIEEVSCQGRKRTYQITEKGIGMLNSEYARLSKMIEESKPFMEETK